MGKFTKISDDAFDALQLDAGVLLDSFDPANPIPPLSDNIIATTQGGINVVCQAEYSDLGEDVDNVPVNMMELKHLDSWTCTMGFTSIKFNATNTVWALGSADSSDGTGYKKIVPRRDLKQSDFKDIWWVGDKANGGAYAVKLKNALSTDGLSIQTTKNGKGTNETTLTGHVSINSQDDMPMEFYDIDPDVLSRITVAAEDQATEMFGTLVSDIQRDDVTIKGTKISGTLKYLSTGSIVSTWGEGNFLALKFDDFDENATSIKAGLRPTYEDGALVDDDSGLVEISSDPDKNGVFKITDPSVQKFKIVSTDGTNTTVQTYDLSNLVCLTA